MTCKIVCTTRTINPYRLGSVNSYDLPVEVVAYCETHNMPMDGFGNLPGHDLCPIGRIEAATAEGLAKIEAARAK